MDPIPFYPLNDFAIKVHLKDVDLTTGKVINLTTGTVTAFVSKTHTSLSTAADGSLNTTCTHVGSGQWLVPFDAFDVTLIESLFTEGDLAYLIVEQLGGIRVYVPLVYHESREAVAPTS